ncbi:Inner membrane transport protein YnfM [compost metagenome]
MASGQVGQRARQARAQASALYLCAYYLGSSVLGYAGGWIWQHFGWSALLVALAGLFLLALLAARRL